MTEQKDFGPLVPPLRRYHEPDMTYDLRWVRTLPEHPDEPHHVLEPLREIKKKTPAKFFAMIAEWEAKYQALLDEEVRVVEEREKNEPKKKAKESKARDAGTVRCLELLDKLINKINAEAGS